MLISRTVDKGTVYERTVYTDPDTPSGQMEELDGIIATFLKGRLTMRVGKTTRKRNGGYQSRRWARRREHEGWMADVRREPSKAYPHPLHV